MGISFAVVIALAVGLVAVLYIRRESSSKARVDESKKPLLKLPIIGDLHSSSLQKPLENWDSWARQNGPIAMPKLFGIVPIVVLNTYEAVNELFSRRSQWYSNRPVSVTMEMITGASPGRSRFTLMHDYDDLLKLHHRILSPSLGAPAAPQYQPMMELESKQLLIDLLKAVQQGSDGTTVSTDAIYPLLERAQSGVILALH